MTYILRLIFITGLLAPTLVQSQSARHPIWELGLFGGVSNYIGDLAPDMVWSESHPAVGLFYKRNSTNGYFAQSLSFNYGAISGNDSNQSSTAFRGLKFQSTLMELSGQLEFNFFKFGPPSTQRTRRFSPYIFTGFSVFHFDPTTTYQGKVYHLDSQYTEGQGFAPSAPAKYKLLQISIPIGGGFKFNLSESFNILVFAGFRGTFTSYLDDVGGKYVDKDLIVNTKGDLAAYFSDPTNVGFDGKQRGNADKKDWYLFSGITISYILPGPICPNF